MLVWHGAFGTVPGQRRRILNFQYGVYALLEGYPPVIAAAIRF